VTSPARPHKHYNIQYTFWLPNGTEERFAMELNRETMELQGVRPADRPPWVALEFHQCPNCPLRSAEHPDCPLALNLVNVARRFDGITSHDMVDLEVVTEERTISQKTTAQRGLGALMGLIIATCGCPHAAFLRPMARFHLPLASNEETTYRATSMYFLAQFFRKREGLSAELSLDGLARFYKEMERVNSAIASRLRAATTTDSSVNAIVVLDVYAKTVEMVIEQSLDRIRGLFEPYLREGSKA
jgi:hypothetical protein